MATLKSRIELLVTGLLSNALDFDGAVTRQFAQRRAVDLDNGAGLNQANVLWDDQRTLGPSASETLDFAGGGLVDAIGVAVLFARLKALVIYASPGNLNNLTILGNAAAIPILNTAATTMTLTPGGLFVYVNPSAAGTVVTPTTFDLIQVANAAGVNSVIYDIFAFGAST